MRHYKATNKVTAAVVEYDAELPQAEHLIAPWSVEDVQVGVASPDAPPDLYLGSWRITRRAYRQRFFPTERIAIEMGALDDPDASFDARTQAAALRTYMDDIADADFIDLQEPKRVSEVTDLESVGLLAPGRAATILNTEPAVEEAWNG